MMKRIYSGKERIYSNKDCILYQPSNWYAHREIVLEGDAPVWVEVSKPYFENVLGVSWMDRAARQKALDEIISQIGDALKNCAGVDADGKRIYRVS